MSVKKSKMPNLKEFTEQEKDAYLASHCSECGVMFAHGHDKTVIDGIPLCDSCLDGKPSKPKKKGRRIHVPSSRV